MSLTEIIGYIGTLLVLTSFLMKEMKKLRIGNIIGSSTFIIYGILLNSIPVIITNVFIVLINAFYLIKENKKGE